MLEKNATNTASKGKPVQHAAEQRQHHPDEKSQTDMQKERDQNRDGADGDPIG